MPIYNWSDLNHGDVFGQDTLPSFDPEVDVLNFDDDSISAAEVIFDGNDVETFFNVGGKFITLDTGPLAVTGSNVTFADSSMLIVGDNDTGTGGDNGPNTIVGGAGDDQLIGLGGADSISGGGGHDLFTIFGDDTGGYGDDTLDGGAGGHDRVVYGDAETGVTVFIGNETASGSATGGDGSHESTLTLIDIDEVTATDFDDVFNANSETEVNGRITDIVQRFEGRGGDDTLNGAEGDGRITIIEFRDAAGAVAINLGEGTAADGDGGTDTFTNVDGVVGSSHDDEIIGGGDSRSRTGTLVENFEGMAGNDTINGAGGQDEARYAFSPSGVHVDLGAGTASDDGWGSIDTLISVERVRGSEFGDVITGDSAANLIEGLGGDDTLDGAGGFDRTRYSRATAGVAVNLGSEEVNLADYGLDEEFIAASSSQSIGAGDDAGVGTDVLFGFEGAQGSDFDDVLVGGDNGTGFDNHDELEGAAGNDTLDGGDTDPASLDLAAFLGDPSGVFVNLSSGDIDLGSETIFAGTARDGFGVNGETAGIDTLLNINGVRGSSYDDTIIGGDADEWFNGNMGWDLVDAGAGNDTIQASGGGDTNLGGMGDDVFLADNSMQVNGRRDDNWQPFEGGAGNDTIFGATGDGRLTTVEYRNAGSSVVVNLGVGTASDGEGGTDTFITTGGSNIDRVIGSMHTDQLTGGGNARSIGGGLNEGFEGLAGHDTIDGGSGADRAMYDYSPGSVIVNLSDQQVIVGDVTVDGGTARDGWNDELNEVDGEAGYTDRLISVNIAVGSGFDDTLIGGDIDEQFEGQEGNDSIDGGEGFDRVRYFRATGAVAVNLSGEEIDLADYGLENQLIAGGTATGIAGDNGVGTDTFVNIEGARGSDFDDVLVGGGAGLIEEGAGIYQNAESFEGLAGDDTLDGGDADTVSLDFASYERSASAVIVNLGTADFVVGAQTISGGTALDGYDVNGFEEGTDTLVNINGAIGSRHDDTLVGGNGDEVFQGGRGNDVIIGGGGIDTIDFDSAISGVVVNLFGGGSTINPFGQIVNQFSALDGQGGIDTFSGIENAIGSGFNDYLQGNSGAANRLEGEAGNDTLIGSGTTETLAGGHLNDTLLGGDGDDVLRQGRGLDSIDGGEGTNDRLEFIGGGSAIAYGAGQASVLVDLFLGTSNADRTNFDTVNGAGGDTAMVANVERVFGTAGHDILTGGSLARSNSDSFIENYRGNAGNDTIDGQGAGFGGRGFSDQVEYENATGAISVNFATGIAQGIGGDNGIGIDKLVNINRVRGTSFNDALTGSDNTGSGRVERFEGRAGSDVINGGGGTDEASYIQSANGVNVNLQTGLASDGWGFTDALISIEYVRGSDHNDVLTGSNNLDVIERFTGEEGNDTINGGAGIDFASWSATELTAGGVNIFIENGFGTVDDGFGFIDTLQNIEGLEGSASDDTLSGGAGTQWFRGRGGDDVLNGGAGVDTADYSVDHLGAIVNLGTTDVIADVGLGTQTVAGGTAHDGFGGVYDLQGTDTLISIENVRGSASADHVTGSSGANLLEGNLGNDTIHGGEGNDTLRGEAGNDVLDGNGGNDTLDGGAGNDVIRGGTEDDVFIDKAGADTLFGGAGNDTFLVDYGPGTVTADGEAGSDTWVLNPNATASTYKVVNFDNSGIGVNRDYIDVGALLDVSTVEGFYTGQDPFAAGFLRFRTVGADKILEWDKTGGGNQYVEVLTLVGLGAQSVTSASFKGFVLGTGGADNRTGSGSDDVMLGLAGNDKLNGGAGNDQLFGGDGVDTLTGGAGNDVYEVDSLSDIVVETAAGGLVLPGGSDEGADGLSAIGDTVIAAINYTLGNFLEHLQLTGAATRGIGNGLANHLVGNAGNDSLVGAGGNDTLNGGVGGDTMDGGTGNDLFLYDSNADIAREAVGATGGVDTVHSSVTLTKLLDANVEHLVLTGTGAINGRGNVLANTLTGNGNKNILDGDAGNDTLNGGAGNDTFKGGAGNDLYIMDAAADVVTGEAAGAAGGTDTVHSTSTQSLDANVENLVLLGALDIDGTGNVLANRITGNANENVLDGGDGIDTLEGGSGNDTLNGGTGGAGGADKDRLVGGDGNDVYIVDRSDETIVETGTANAGNHDVVHSSATFTLGANVENLVLTGAAAISGTGNGLNNEITGNNAVNRLNGSTGNDTIDGGGGNDTLQGGAGFDSLFWGAGDVLVDGGADYDRLFVTGGNVLIDLTGFEDGVLADIEEINLAGDGDNTLMLTVADILDLGTIGNALVVNGDEGDALDAGEGWVQEDDQTLGDVDYQVYTQDGAMLFVSHALDLTIGLVD